MDQTQFEELVEKVGKEAATKIQSELKSAEKRINDANAERVKGLMKSDDFEKFKSEEMAKINEKLDEIGKLDEAVKEIGQRVDAGLEKIKSQGKTINFAEFIEQKAGEIKKMKESGTGVMVFTASELKDAGVTSIGGSIGMDSPPTNPYAPGLAGTSLELFEILRNPNYILNQVDVGRTNQARLAWMNETALVGNAALVTEGNEKPLIEHQFKVETSTAKKLAGYVKITEEFEEDIPGLSTAVRRMLGQDVLRSFDDTIQAGVISSSTAYSLAAANGTIVDANYWDALRMMWAQVVTANFSPNSVGINPVTGAILDSSKDIDGGYAYPHYAPNWRNVIVEANKVVAPNAFVGDLRQYKVDIYKDLVFKIGWVNDDFIRNQFCVLAEIRYHNYISDARKAGIVYANLNSVKALIDSASSS